MAHLRHHTVRTGPALTRGERAAEQVATTMGSWAFIGIQTLMIVVWIGANVVLLARPFDPYPFILLNLAFSTQAAYAAPILQLASNRQTSQQAELLVDLHRLADCLHRSPDTGPCTCRTKDA